MAIHEVTFPVTDPAEILKLRAGDEVIVQGHILGIGDGEGDLVRRHHASRSKSTDPSAVRCAVARRAAQHW